jgi:hypothetical protein
MRFMAVNTEATTTCMHEKEKRDELGFEVVTS